MSTSTATLATLNRAPRIIYTIGAVTALFIGTGFLAIKFGGPLSTTLLGIIASILAPTLAALFAMLVVNPLRELKSETASNGVKIGEVKELVNGQMTALRQEIARLNAKAEAMAEAQATKDIASASEETKNEVRESHDESAREENLE